MSAAILSILSLVGVIMNTSLGQYSKAFFFLSCLFAALVDLFK